LQLKSLLESEEIDLEKWETLSRKIEKFGMTCNQLFHNFEYSTSAEKSLVEPINEGYAADYSIATLLCITFDGSDKVLWVLSNKKQYGTKLISLINLELDSIENAALQVKSDSTLISTEDNFRGSPTSVVNLTVEGLSLDQNDESADTTSVITTDKPNINVFTEETQNNVPSTCCSATVTTSLAATLWVSLGGALTAASTLVYLNHPSVAFLFGLHAPQALVIAAAVIGALLLVYGLELLHNPKI
jgi:hypothetical protein